LRIIGGKLRSRKFGAPQGNATRPTGDRAKVALFNILGGALDGARVLDGFAGSGALSFEAVSRGAALAVLYETDGAAAAILKENAEKLGIEDSVEIHCADFMAEAPKLAGKYSFNVVFLDPPYSSGLLEGAVAIAEKLLAPSGIVVAEHSESAEMPETIGHLDKSGSRRYGAAAFTFYKRREDR
jgi:16S rRNA (guanine966-N2)-methyltransferase